jgi:very-short-patch-repair endonuclease
MLRYREDLKSRSRDLRSAMTDAEQLLWSRLRRKQIEGVQFYRQKPIGKFIVDFHAPRCGLVVEVDGSQHLDADGLAQDEKRTALLTRMRLKVLRFDNLQVLKETEAVLEVIYKEVVAALSSAPKSPPAPLFQRGESQTQYKSKT